MKRSYARDSTDATPPFLRRVINITGWYMWDILIRLVRKSLRSMKFIKQSFLPWDFTWRVSDCEELVEGQSHYLVWLTLNGLKCTKLSITILPQVVHITMMWD